MNRCTPDDMYNIDFAVHKREYFSRVLTLENADGSKYDLSGMDARGQIRAGLDEASPIIHSLLCTVDDSASTVTIELPTPYTEEITAGQYFYDVCLIWQYNGIERRRYLIGGKFLILPSVTH